MADIIRIARDSVIEPTRLASLLFLDKCNHLVGQQWQVRYYRDEDETEIDTLVAIGVKNGIGNECYRVISYGTRTAITAITETLPDVSELAHDEVCIVKIDDVWNYVTVTDNTRCFDPIVGGPYAYYNLEDGYVWYYTDGVLRREDNFYTREELDDVIASIGARIDGVDQTLLIHRGILDAHTELLQEHSEKLIEHEKWLHDLDTVCFPLTITVSASPTSTTWASGTSHDITFSFSAKKLQRDGETEKDVTSNCKYYYKLDGSSSDYIEVTNPFKLFDVTGENQTITYSFKGGNTEEYGKLQDAGSVSYKFGYRFLYGVTSGTLTNVDSLSTSGITMKSTYYSASYTTTLNNLATFAIPVNWGTISKITDSSGITDYTSSFEKLSGTFNRTVDGLTVMYYVYRWSSLPTVATNFTYRFYN